MFCHFKVTETYQPRKYFGLLDLLTCKLFTYTVEDSKKTYLNLVKSEGNVPLMRRYINNKGSTNHHYNHGQPAGKCTDVNVCHRYAELESFTSLDFKPSNKKNCDKTFDTPVIFMKLDAGKY